MSALFEFNTFKLRHGEKFGVTSEDQFTDFCVDRRLRTFSSDLIKERGSSTSRKAITLRPIQSALGNISQLGRLSMTDTAAAQSMGSSTGMSLVGGTLDLIGASKAQKKAELIGDKKAVVASLVNQIEGGVRALAGLGYCFFRVAKIRSFLNNSLMETAASSISDKIAASSGVIGDVGFGISYILESALSAYRFYETRKFDNSFKQSESILERSGLKFLIGKVTINPSLKLQQLRASWSKLPTQLEKDQAIQSFKKNLEEKALDALSEKGLELYDKKPLSLDETRYRFIQYFKELENLPSFSEEFRKQYVDSLGLTPEEVQDFSLVELVGFFVEENKRGLRKESKMERRIGSDCLEMIQKAASRGLFERLSAGGSIGQTARSEYQVLSSKIHEICDAKQKAHLWMVVTSIVGVIVSVIGVLSLVGLCSVPPAVTLVLLLTFVALLCFADVSSLKAALTQGPVGKRDKLYLIFISAVLLLSFATTVGLVLALHVAVMELIKAGVICIAGSGLNFYAFICLKRREKAWKESHPDLTCFKEILANSSQEALTEEAASLFKKLPKEKRLAIREAYETLDFQTERYKLIDQSYGFGSYFLDKSFDSTEIDLFQKGVKKALKHCWKQSQEDKTNRDKLETALKMQAFFEMIVSRDRKSAIKAYNEIRKNTRIERLIQQNVSYVFKRQESQKALLEVICRDHLKI